MLFISIVANIILKALINDLVYALLTVRIYIPLNIFLIAYFKRFFI